MITAILLCCTASIAACVVSFAEFTNSKHAQRTIAVYDTGGVRFSSNHLTNLTGGGVKTDVRTIYTAGEEAIAYVTVCNYPQGAKTLLSNEDLTYTVRVRLVSDSGSGYDDAVPDNSAVLPGDDHYFVDVYYNDQASPVATLTTSGSVTIPSSGSYTLDHSAAQTDEFTVVFSSVKDSGGNEICLEMVAVPSVPGYPTLAAIFKPASRLAEAASSWEGEFRDNHASLPSAYDGFNYLITGSGSGTVTLTWDTTHLALSAVSQKTLQSITGATVSSGSAVFPVNSDEENRYDLQFYKTDVSTAADWDSWADLEAASTGYLQFTFSIT